ncbi:MAG: DUF421 domain-containing protein [Clostridia bacterium]|nr:DUF421 domain-containing protein [Clostridia bacterium]
MLTLIIRAIIVYLLVLVVFRIMGKRQLGQMQPFELVLTLIIADLATIPMAESSIPTLNGVIPLITLVVVHFLLTYFSKKSNKISQIISGKPIVIVNPNGIVFDALQQLDISIDDLFEAIRSAGYFKLEEVQYAIMETNGTVNVLPKSAFATVTNNDLKIKTEEATMPFSIICEGGLLKENLKLAKINENEVLKILKKARIENIKNVLVLTLDKQGNCYIQEKNKPFQTLKTSYKGGNLT